MNAEPSPLYAAAFGAAPGRWPLPPAATPVERWWRAVAAAGQGRYASARTELAEIRRAPGGAALDSLAHSTEASLLRQLGWHLLARRWDGRALALADGGPAHADSLVGLAADALGVGRFAAAGELLGRARRPPTDLRVRVRLAWVSAELAMATGHGADAVRSAEAGLDVAEEFGSARHVVKTRLVLAAALCSTGRLDDARGHGDQVLDATERHGLLPLRWAVSGLLADIGSARGTRDELLAINEACAVAVERRGGRWRHR
ncbi:hypothetical protein LV457_05590 [Mycobacterium sp. MYCO198283]|uniref:hypothetical protein n=1 Tax=Mycobacterium sp. MYCO198283 TaxID=2883505 RepID=UPI001E42A4F0|nr:hypothetical protein [Mycobacterium sp. MYCO198283]MCG5431764.1 hypothetical protein [Mycobacterium sp. MYCO198283]